MGHIFLVGFMGSGKTTIGRVLSKTRKMDFFDTDDAIVKKDGRSISRIFEESGEGYFRLLETMILEEMPEGNLVVSCGGGMATRDVNIEIMKKKGCIVYLCATPATILERVKNNNKRPILEGNKNIEFISDLMKKRTPYYEKAADHIIVCDDKGIEEIVGEIRDLLT